MTQHPRPAPLVLTQPVPIWSLMLSDWKEGSNQAGYFPYLHTHAADKAWVTVQGRLNRRAGVAYLRGTSFPHSDRVYPAPKIFPSSGAAALVLIAVLLLGCGRVEQPWTEEIDWSSTPVSESWDVTFHVSETDLGADDTRPRLSMETAYMATFESDSTYTVLEGGLRGQPQARATIYDKTTGEPSAVVLADRITYNDRDRRFEAVGDVFVDAAGERTLRSERLVWQERTRSVRAPGFVQIVTPRERIEGYNLDADEDLDNYRLERVTGEAQIEDDDATLDESMGQRPVPYPSDEEEDA